MHKVDPEAVENCQKLTPHLKRKTLDIDWSEPWQEDSAKGILPPWKVL